MSTELPLKIERHSSESHTIEIQAPFKLFFCFFLALALLILGVFDKIYLTLFLPFFLFLFFQETNFI